MQFPLDEGMRYHVRQSEEFEKLLIWFSESNK